VKYKSEILDLMQHIRPGAPDVVAGARDISCPASAPRWLEVVCKDVKRALDYLIGAGHVERIGGTIRAVIMPGAYWGRNQKSLADRDAS
jgi:hypothetical protein